MVALPKHVKTKTDQAYPLNMKNKKKKEHTRVGFPIEVKRENNEKEKANKHRREGGGWFTKGGGVLKSTHRIAPNVLPM